MELLLIVLLGLLLYALLTSSAFWIAIVSIAFTVCMALFSNFRATVLLVVCILLLYVAR